MIFKKIIKFFTNKLLFFFRDFMNIYNERTLYIFLKLLRNHSLINNRSKLLFEFKIYPKNPKKLFPVHTQNDNISVIIQGPVFDRDFIQSTIDWYKNCGIKNIIFSTSEDVKSFRGCITLVTKSPLEEGIWNENNHLQSIKSGLEIINDDSLVIKTRSDQRIFNETAFTVIKFLHESYESSKTFNNSRLGVISNNSTIIKINNISDHLYIGNCLLLKKMFDIKFRNKINLLKDLNLNPVKLNFIRYKLKSSFYTELEAEQWFFNSFRKNCFIKNSQEEILISKNIYIDKLSKYLDILIENIYVIDPEDIGLYWTKSSIDTLPSFYHNSLQNKKSIDCFRLTRYNWLTLVNDISFKKKILEFAKGLDANHFLF